VSFVSFVVCVCASAIACFPSEGSLARGLRAGHDSGFFFVQCGGDFYGAGTTRAGTVALLAPLSWRPHQNGGKNRARGVLVSRLVLFLVADGHLEGRVGEVVG
jgi:hypothetical protein